MKVYLDVSCLNRPFDDQSQARIRHESEAVTMILDRCQGPDWCHVSSAMAQIEIDAMQDETRRARVQLLLPEKSGILELTRPVHLRASALTLFRFKPADALHVAAAESLIADVLLSCDDRLCRLGRRHAAQLKVSVANPVAWLKEIGNAIDS